MFTREALRVPPPRKTQAESGFKELEIEDRRAGKQEGRLLSVSKAHEKICSFP